MSEEDLPLSEMFAAPEEGETDPRPIMQRLIEEVELFKDLLIARARIVVFFRGEPKVKAGKTQLGFMSLPKFSGTNADLAGWLLAEWLGGDMPDFILLLDRTFWDSATAHQREALLFHELLHCRHAVDKDGEPKMTDEGMPVWEIRPHDIEEFGDVVARYGAWLPDVQRFADSLAQGGVTAGAG